MSTQLVTIPAHGFSHEALTFNVLVVLYLMAESGGNGEYMVTFNTGRIDAVRHVGKRRRTADLVDDDEKGVDKKPV